MSSSRPRGGALTFACSACRMVLADGVDYTWCPRCDGELDRVDARQHVWMCDTCRVPVNGSAVAPACDRCERPLVLLSAPVRTSPTTAASPLGAKAIAMRVLAVLLVVQAVFA